MPARKETAAIARGRLRSTGAITAADPKDRDHEAPAQNAAEPAEVVRDVIQLSSGNHSACWLSIALSGTFCYRDAHGVGTPWNRMFSGARDRNARRRLSRKQEQRRRSRCVGHGDVELRDGAD